MITKTVLICKRCFCRNEPTNTKCKRCGLDPLDGEIKDEDDTKRRNRDATYLTDPSNKEIRNEKNDRNSHW